jgi:polyhydroxybutyrate depolymerase
LTPGDHAREISHAGRTRSYLVHIPAAVADGEPAPVVLFFHGGTGTAAHAARSYSWNEKADTEGFIVVYPNGTGRLQTWNAMHCCGEALRDNVDDVGFVRALLDDLKSVATIDESRIYATGMSNGAMFTHRLASEMSDVIAAIAPVAGTMGGRARDGAEERRPSAPNQAVSVMIIHGLKDRNAPYHGGRPEVGLVRERSDISIPETAKFWAEVNVCDAAPRPIALDPALAGKVEGEEYVNPATGRAEVAVIRIIEGGHAWPGGAPPARRGADPPIREWSATDAIWEFFRNHPKPPAPTAPDDGSQSPSHPGVTASP